MKKLTRGVMWAALALIIMLFVFSVYGAFIGAARAQKFFNCIPLSAYWVAFAVLFIAGLLIFPRLLRVPALLMMHLGCVLILIGGMWGSGAGHKIQKNLFGINKIKSGRMVIHEGYSENRVLLEDSNQPGELPFMIKLKDFRIEYYKSAELTVQTRDGQTLKMPIEQGAEVDLGPELGTVKIIRTFERFRFIIEGDRKEAVDAPQGPLNPAVEILITHPDGSTATRYAFENFPSHEHPEDKFTLRYHRTISDYISDLQVIDDGKVAAEKSIEVNHPLKFGGYHFYQSSYDVEAGEYTVLQVTADTGLATVYAGYILLCVGAAWHLWLKPAFKTRKAKSE